MSMIVYESTARYRHDLPQLGDAIFITDGGLETVLTFQKQVELPMFAAFDLLNSADGIEKLKDYYTPYIELALSNRSGLILDTATWRASVGWGEKLGYSAREIRQFNQLSVAILQTMRDRYAHAASPIVINGAIGPRDDGYQPQSKMDAIAAQAYHRHQVDAFAASPADMVTAVTMTYADEAIGIANAAKNAGLPVVISFTVETDGRLPDGTTLEQAVTTVDDATSQAPVYYMINCAHPSHFEHVLHDREAWTDRIFGVRANASSKSHAELDEADELDDGDPREFARLYVQLRDRLRNLRVVGGCCGTDHRHIGELCRKLL